MSRLLIVFLAFSTSLAASASTGDAPVLRSHCGGQFQLCGYAEQESEAPRIPQQYEVAGPFSEGLAAVRINGLFGFINLRGEIVIAPRFQSASAFSDGYAEVRIDNASGAIDRSGRLVIPPQFRRLIHFSGGTFIAEPLPDGYSPQLAQAKGLEALSEAISLTGIRAAGLYHRDRGWLTETDFKFSIFDEPRRGLIWAGKRNDQGDDQWGLIRADGSWQVSPRFNHVQRLVETHAIVDAMPDYLVPRAQRREEFRRGAVDRDGNLVVPTKFAQLSYWNGGYGGAMEGRPYGLNGRNENVREGIVKADGSLLADRYFDEVDRHGAGTLPRARIGDTWYSVTQQGQLVSDELDGQPMVECEGGLTVLRRGEEVEFRIADRAVGRFDNMFFGQRKCPGPFSTRRGDRWFYVLENGTVLGGEDGFETTYSFSGSHAAVQIDGTWGIIDRTGSFSVRPQYSKLRPDRSGTFAVGEGEGTYWINASGIRVEQPTMKRPSPQRALTCKGGLRFFQKEGLWGFQDQSGQTIIKPRFRALSCFQQGVSWAVEPGGDGWCAIGPDGARREAMECGETYYPVSVSHHYPEKFDEDPFENSVLWNRGWLDYQAGNRDEPPSWIGDGIQSSASYSVKPGGVGGPLPPKDKASKGQSALPLTAKSAALGIAVFAFSWSAALIWKRRTKVPPGEFPT
jgi:hypothetical protein